MENTTLNTTPPPAATPSGRRHGPATWLALLLALGALLACAWFLQELRRVSAHAGAQALDAQRAALRLDTVAAELGGMRAQVRELAALESELAERLAATRAALDPLLESRGNVDLALAEVEYLLILAEHRLVLMQDPDTATAALEAARQRLTGLDAPGLDAVRGQVEVDLLRLRDVPRPDFRRWHGELVTLARAVADFPLRAGSAAEDSAPEPPAPGGWRGLVHSIWRELRSFVVVTRSDAGAPALPGQETVLVQALQLRIESARLALLRRDGAALRDAAMAASAWLEQWFEPSHAGVRAAGAQLRELAALEPAPALPGITSSLETLRALQRERTPPGAPAAADVPAP